MGNAELQLKKKIYIPCWDSARKAPGAHTSSPSLCSPDKQACDVISKGDVAWRALSTGCPCWGCQALPVTPRGIPPPGGGLSSAACGGGREESRAELGSAVPPSPSLCSWPLTRMMWVLQCLSLGQGVPKPDPETPRRPAQGPSCRPFTSCCHH